jgi:membrane-bound lytic murein transglycosylase B
VRRRDLIAAMAAGLAWPVLSRAQSATAADFAAWVTAAEAAALLAGISQGAVSNARTGLAFNPSLIRPAGAQSESGRVGPYVQRLVASDTGVARARRAAWPQIGPIEARYGVPGSVLVAFWGRESGYGRDMGSLDVFSTLATLGAARAGSSTDWTAEYIAALRIVERRSRPRAAMRGSGAGAMGHTQLMPSSYITYGEDFDGDGRVDVWSPSPLDALASAARHVQHVPAAQGPIPATGTAWVRGGGWIEPVRLTRPLDYQTVEVEVTRMTPSAWEALGVRKLAPGPWRPVDQGQPAALALPAGLTGPAFLLFPNFSVFEAYNPSRTYALGVGLLARAIDGAPGVDWPAEVPITIADRQAAQRALTTLGFYSARIDGDLGAGSRAAIRRWQRSQHLPADGYLTASIVAQLTR